MPDVAQDLSRYAAAVADHVPPVDIDTVRSSRRRRSLAPLAAAAVVLAALAGALIVWAAQDDPSSITTVDDGPAPATSSPAPPSTDGRTTTTTAPATRTFRTFAVTAVAGGEYLVWGGEAGDGEASVRADGFAVDLRTGAVRPIPVAPIDPRSAATGVWTGEELIVCCGFGQADGSQTDTRSAAAWNPQTGRWRLLTAPPASIARSFPTSVWTGEQMIVVSRESAAAAYDPDADTWNDMPAPPLTTTYPESVWTGTEMIVWDRIYDPFLGTEDRPADKGWRWTPGNDRWEPLPDMPAGSRTQEGSIAWTGQQVFVWGQSTADDALGVGALWTPGTDRWQTVSLSPQGPVDPYNGTPGSQALAATEDGRVIVAGLDDIELDDTSEELYLYDTASDTWRTLNLTVAGYHPPITHTDGQILLPDEAEPIVGVLEP